MSESPVIGPCEWCGWIDHRLAAGECPTCRAKPHLTPTFRRDERDALGVESDLTHLDNELCAGC